MPIAEPAGAAPLAGYTLIDELATSKLFGDYVRAFPEAARDAGDMLRVAVQVGLVERYQGLLERALLERRAVPDEAWHALLAEASWPRSLPEWDRGPIGDWRLRWNSAATSNWPEEFISGCWFGSQHPEMAWGDDARPRFLRNEGGSPWQRLRDCFVDWLRRRAI